MRTIILLGFLFCFIGASAQDYSCIRTDTSFFAHGNLQRAIHIDSVAEFAGHTSYYNYFTLGPEDENQFCYTDQFPSWIGSHVDIRENGDHYFFNWYGDSIFIKTSAQLNESWTCFNFDGGDYIQARVIAYGPEQFLGVSDTVKTIRFNAYDLSGNPVICPCNDLTIKISRSHGMIRALNFNEFPDIYFMMGSSLDEYDLCGWSSPPAGLQNLTIRQVFDFDPGDEMHIYEHSMSWLQDNFRYYEIHRVLDKQWMNDSVVFYSMERCFRQEYILSDTLVTGHDTTNVYMNIHSYEDPGMDHLPETPVFDDSGFGEYYFYYQGDAPVPDRVSKTFLGGFFYDPWEECITMMIDYDYSKYYVEGLGGPYWDYGSFGSENLRELVYFKKGDEEWGEPYSCDSLLITGNSEPFEIIAFSMAPNPMEESTRIIINTQGETSISYQLLDSMGTVLREGQMDNDGYLIHREDLASGIYFLRILGSKSILGTQKLIIR